MATDQYGHLLASSFQLWNLTHSTPSSALTRGLGIMALQSGRTPSQPTNALLVDLIHGYGPSRRRFALHVRLLLENSASGRRTDVQCESMGGSHDDHGAVGRWDPAAHS